MAQPIAWLALSGARDSSGTAVSSGRAWFYQPGGGTTSATVYSDVAATVVAPNPATLDAGGRALVYVTAPVRIVVQTAAGLTVTDVDQASVARAEAVQLANTGWSDTYLDSVLSKLYASTGGVNGQYQESGGASARTIRSKFAELSISVKDFGAKGDGLTVDTTSIQAAINRVGFLGGGEVYFPPGTYLVDQVLAVGSNGVSLRGAAATLQNQSSTLGLFTYTHAGTLGIRGLQLTNVATSTGTAIAMTDCSRVVLDGVVILGHQGCISLATLNFSSSQVTIANSILIANDSAAGSRCVSSTNATSLSVVGSFLGAGTTGVAVELLGSSGMFSLTGSTVTGGNGVKFNSNLTGTGFAIVGNDFSSIATAAFIFGAAAMPKRFSQSSNGVDGYKHTLASGDTYAPDLSKGWTIVLDGAATGSAYTISVPTPAPATTDYGVYFELVLYNHAGGAITGWGLAAGYHLSSAASTTDTHRTSYRFWWDPDNSVWRDVARTDTT